MADGVRNRENSEVGTQGGRSQSRRSRNSLFDLKMEVRQALMPLLPAGGFVYMAYAGACKLAAAYPGRDVYAAEIQAAMFADGVPDNVVSWVVADCNREFPFGGLSSIAPGPEGPWLAGDFDHYHMPYPALRRFLEGATLAERAALFFTDTAQRRLFYHPREIEYPNGYTQDIRDREYANDIWERYVPGFMLPNLMANVLPGYEVVKWEERRRRNTIIWGVVVDRRS